MEILHHPGFYLALVTYLLTLSFVPCNARDPWPTLNSSLRLSSSAIGSVRSRNHRRKTLESKLTFSSDTCCHCKIFVWDVVSYFKYKVVVRQINQNIYEGLGGRKFVRIKPGSCLESWYPNWSVKLKKYGCIFCGYSFADHLKYWWNCKKGQEKLSTYDRFLDKTFSDLDRDVGVMGSYCSNILHPFYRQYVREIGPRNMKQIARNERIEIVGAGEHDVLFHVPSLRPYLEGERMSLWTVVVLSMARAAAIERVKDLVWYSKVEYAMNKK